MKDPLPSENDKDEAPTPPLMQDTLQLDRRARAMLKAMGIQWSWPSAPAHASAPAPAPAPAPEPTPIASAPPSPTVTTARSSAPPLRTTVTALEPTRVPEPERVERIARVPVRVDDLRWETLDERLQTCESCALCEGRSGTLAGWGSPTAKWLFVVDHMPSTERNQQPVGVDEFTLFQAIYQAMGLTAEEVFMTSLTKCRAAPGAAPIAEDIAQCAPYLQQQIQWLQPHMVVAMGLPAAQALLDSARTQGRALGQLRGQVHPSPLAGEPAVVVTYPLAAMLRSASEKPKAWADLCLALFEVDARTGQT